ncbi:hypothetical protein BTO15_04005 [Polaribacter sejongensis]|uniref:O-antigen ligase family protein n=1 Tax=Polaribacter sejongensis TaxID=985043 RepID=A0AAJ1QZG9_9FLAO|nr:MULTISPECIES: O-antigen ligase family protein [Polaribacter]AUC21319.1 hypothetical protein BTO15_04005 [Polaribacter sejongensis]MDN3620965.1 O-antigen ligase family protein [Polaribacter undariae]UWD31098.1 O-antigen ligase family protein [Polaribacter undariae]
MTLTIKKIWPVLLVVSFVLHREVTSIEVNTILLLVLTSFVVLLNKGKMIKRDFDVLSLLLLIICIGSFTAIFNKPSAYNFIRDLLYFTKPVLLILLGYFLTRLINDWKVVFKALIYLGVGYAVYHILHFVIFTNFNHPHIISHIRGVNGLSNIIEVFSIALIVLGNKYKEYSIFSKKSTKYICLFLLFTSFTLYFSRTMFVGLVLLVLGVLNYLKLNKKGLKYLGLLLLAITILYTYLFTVKIDRKGDGIENFLYKLKIAPSEIFSPKIDLNNHASLWDHWRAYEALRGLQGLNESPVSYVGGKGFGALVDLKFAAPISSEGTIRYIPILHNGYIFILYKTGVIGLLIYLYFLFSLYFQAYRKTDRLDTKNFGNLLSATSLYLIFSSLIITGLYNLQEETAIILGIFLYLKSNSNRKN